MDTELDKKFIKPLSFRIYSENAILISWEELIDQEILSSILHLKNLLKIHYEGIKIELVNSYASLLVIFHQTVSLNEELKFLTSLSSRMDLIKKTKGSLIEIPVCYEDQYGIDLKHVSEVLNLPPKRIIELHTKSIYQVYFIGFLPGFFYLGGLSNALHVPRRISPRMQVPKGAVAIGGKQTGIYPQKSPGGWHIIGSTPISVFDTRKTPKTIVKSGDQIRFIQVDKQEYTTIKRQIKLGSFNLKIVPND